MWPRPRGEFRPAHWRYSEAKAALDAAGRLINTELAERRNLILANPAGGYCDEDLAIRRGDRVEEFAGPFEAGASVLDALLWLRAHRDRSSPARQWGGEMPTVSPSRW